MVGRVLWMVIAACWWIPNRCRQPLVWALLWDIQHLPTAQCQLHMAKTSATKDDKYAVWHTQTVRLFHSRNKEEKCWK